MYGMVNKAIEDLVCARFGALAWEQVKRVAGVEVDVFITDESYPDDVTYRLIEGACRVLGRDGGDVLRLFGEHWLLHTARNGYGTLLDAGGQTLPEFLVNLPDFHTRVALLFPNLQPPEFLVTDRTATSLRLHYRSRRRGLEPFVEGILRGVGRRFDTPVVVTTLPPDEHDGHAIFLVSWAPTP